jgi:integrase
MERSLRHERQWNVGEIAPATDLPPGAKCPRAVKPGLHFDGLRHSHKTWMIDDGVPEIAQALRLGHVLQDKVQETYSHVAVAVEQRLLDGLQTRWEKAVASSTTPSDQCLWRSVAA